MKIADINAGKALKVLMAKREVSREQLSQDLGMSTVTVSSLRNSKLISGSNLVKICDYFQIKASSFFELGEEE